MFAHIVSGDVGEAGIKVAAGGVFGNRSDWVIGPKCVGNPAPAPSAAEVEAVKMCNLAVASIRYGGRGEERYRLAAFEAREEGVEPLRKCFALKRPAHEQRFAQGW